MEETEEAALPNLPLLSVLDDDDDDADPKEGKEDGDEENRKTKTTRREMCWSGCGRPSSVCLCAYLPPNPLSTSTTLVVLHHPHELRLNPLATLPLLARSLIRCHLVPGRRLRPGSHPLLDSLLQSPTSDALFLFPGGREINLFAAERSRCPPPRPAVLVVFDGTWRQAREMVAASRPFLDAIGATPVSVIGEGYDEGAEGPSTFESELVLRKEPFKGCMSTMEAVARALRALEPAGTGAEIEERLLGVLRAMVASQSRHLKPTNPRPKMRKKKEIRKMENSMKVDQQ